MAPLLGCRPILHSRDIEKARAFLAERAIQLELPGCARDRAGFDACYNGVYMRGMWLGYLRYGATVSARIDPARGDYWVHLPMEGAMAVSGAAGDGEFDASTAALTSPLDVCTLRTEARTARLSVALRGEALNRQLADLLEDAPREPLRLAGAMDLRSGFGRFFAQLLHGVAGELSRGELQENPLAESHFEQSVMTSQLLSQPHNHSAGLRRWHAQAAPRDVRRAVEYVRAHAAEAISLGDLVRASGVAGRTLLKHFRDTYGVSPMRYLRRHRLRRVREALLAGGEETVSAAASRWGFAHLGRFAEEYRECFGESPSCTRARSRR